MKPAINHFVGGYPGPFDPRFVGKPMQFYDINTNHVRYARFKILYYFIKIDAILVFYQ